MSMKDVLQTPQFNAQAAALAAAGWELEWDGLGWVTAVHPQYGRTPATYPRPGRGLKFAIVAVDRVHLAHGLPPIEVSMDVRQQNEPRIEADGGGVGRFAPAIGGGSEA